MSQLGRCAVTSIVTLVLLIRRASGRTETYELPAEGDDFLVPPELLRSDDVFVEVFHPRTGGGASDHAGRDSNG